MRNNRIRKLTILFAAGIIAVLDIASCDLHKSVSVTTGRYDNVPDRHFQPNIEIEMSRDTVATYRF